MSAVDTCGEYESGLLYDTAVCSSKMQCRIRIYIEIHFTYLLYISLHSLQIITIFL